MNTGTLLRTASYTFLIYWEPAGATTDLNMGGRLGRWVRQNEKAIDKLKVGMDAIKLLTEQFPALTLVEAKHSNGLLARYQK
jgi:hypothetical protein